MEVEGSDEESQPDRERQPDEQQASRQPRRPSKHPQIGVGRIREQHQCQGQLGQRAQHLSIGLEGEQVETFRPDQKAEGRKDHRAAHPRPLDAPGDEAVQTRPRQQRQTFIHEGHGCVLR